MVMLDTTGQFTKKDNPTSIAAVAVLALVGAMVLVFLGCFVQAWILCKLWMWYIVPFFEFKPLTLPIAYGISLIVHFVQNIVPVKDKRKASEKIVTAIARPVLVLLFGWLGTLFI
jgi:hypothetical protein